MGLGIKEVMGALSPVYGAVTGKGMFGNLLGKQSEEEHAADLAKAAADADAAAQKQAQQQAQNQNWIRASQGMKKGGKVVKMAKGGSTSSASRRGDGIATKGKTRGKMV